MTQIETTLHITSYNRPFLLKECVESFFSTCLYDTDKLELIIVDNGSTNTEVRNYIRNLEPPCAHYTFVLNEENDYPSCLRYAKIQAREIALGKYFIDCPDDHLFVVRSGWIDEALNQLRADPTAGCIVYFANPAYRFKKSNNAMDLIPGSVFYRSRHKGYADYHIMSRDIYHRLGKYQHRLGRKAESEYMTRASNAGLYRNLIKYPVAIVNDDMHSLYIPIDDSVYRKIFDEQLMPVTNEQLIQLGVDLNAIKREV